MNPTIDITAETLSTERLLLRPFRQEDLDDFYEYARVEGVGEMAGWCHHDSILESQAILDLFIDGKHDFAIVYKGKVIGSFGIKDYPEALFAEYQDLKGKEIGYVLNKDYWNQGLATEATQAVIDYLFNQIHLDFILVGHFIHNHRSQRVIEKNGFQYLKNIQYETAMKTIEECKMYILRNPKTTL